jgi:ribosomal protein L37AE/L43A
VSSVSASAVDQQVCPACDSDNTECQNARYGTFVCLDCGERWADDEEEGNLDRSSSHKTRLDKERE